MTKPHIATDAVRKQLKKVLDRGNNRANAERVRNILKGIKMTPRIPIKPDLIQKRWVNVTDLNINSILFGGRLLTWVDQDASLLIAENTDVDFVTGSVFLAEFKKPARAGQRLTFYYTMVHFSHATITVKANVLDIENEEIFRCYMTFVGINVNDCRATNINCKVNIPNDTESWAFVERYRKFIEEN